MRYKSTLLFTILLSSVLHLGNSVTAFAQELKGQKVIPVVSDALIPLEMNEVKMAGFVGEKIDLCIENRILAEDYNHLVEPFKHRDECRLWQSEFWGKWFTSAVLAYRYTNNSTLLTELHNAVYALIETQSADGYIGNYDDNCHLKYWDIWGRKYCLLGLLSYYDITGDEVVLEAAKKIADHLFTEVGPQGANIVTLGNFRGMAASSILEPMVWLYRSTGDEKYLNFAKYIVRQWETVLGPQLIGKALDNTPVSRRFILTGSTGWWSWNNGQKAYEMMSCYEGLTELYRITGDKTFLKALKNVWQNIKDTEINIVGSGAAAECWYGGKAMQATPTEDTQETCVTVTWLKLTYQLFKLTGDPKYADQLENTTYNALLGAMKPDGSTFTKYTPLEGIKRDGLNQCGMDLNCCTANGPRGIMRIPLFTVMKNKRGPVVNIYNKGEYTTSVNTGNFVTLKIDTNYPVTGHVKIVVQPQKNDTFTIGLRVPEWSLQTAIKINGEEIDSVVAGTYKNISRSWEKGDVIEMNFDMRAKIVTLKNLVETLPPHIAVQRGPIVLARDSRLNSISVDEVVLPVVKDEKYVNIRVAENSKPWAWMAFDISFKTGAQRMGGVEELQWLTFCDYASAGNSWGDESRYKVWSEQPFDPTNGKK